MTPTAPLVAFVFANLAMLGWLAAAAAPILIHLWMRQTHRETAWAAVRFLRAALERQARKLRLQHWLLLATRTMLLVLLALAAAKPMLESGLLGGGAPTHRVLVLDASLSMNTIDADGRSALDRAKRSALEVLDAARPGDTHSLVVMGADAGTPLGRPVADAPAVRRAIEAVAPSQGVADLAPALAAATRLVENGDPSAKQRRHEAFFFTDLGVNTWDPIAGERAEAPLAGPLDALMELARVSVVDVGGSPLPNAAVTAASLAEGLPTLAAPLEVRAEARLFGADSAERVAELVVDGVTVAARRVTLTKGKPTPLDFLHKLQRPGVTSLTVRLAAPKEGGDPLAEDDARYMALAIRPRVKVLLVAGAPRAADYLADALDPTGDGAFEPVVVSDADLPTVEPADYACLFFSNVRELSPAEAQRLRGYVERGGGVAWFLGDRVSADRYNQMLAPPRGTLGVAPAFAAELRLVAADGARSPAKESAPSETDRVAAAEGLLPGWLAPAVSAPSFRIDPHDYSHPIVRPFEGQERAGLLNIPVTRHFPVELPRSGRTAVALELEGGDPLLVTSELGRGRVALVTTAATLDVIDPATGQPWTALPAWPSFLPIVRGLVTFLAKEGDAPALLVGQPIEGFLGSSSGGVVEVVAPEGAEGGRIAPDASGAWAYRATRAAGVYRFGPEGQPAAGAAAVNVDPAESDPATVPEARLPEGLVVRRWAAGSDMANAAGETPTPIHRWLLYGALALALVEPVMACRFGRGSA